MAEIEYVELGSICEVVRGGSPRPIIDYITEDDDGVNWLKIGDVSETDKYFTHANEKIKPSGISKTRPVVAGDLILSNSMSFGRAFITLIDGYIHDGWLRLRCDTSKIDKEYLYYFLTSSIAQNQFKAVATGSVVNNLKADTVKATQIALPTLAEQKKIATVLSMIDEKIVINNAINRNLHEQINALYAGQFEPYIMSENLPKGWEMVKIEDVAEIKNGYAFKGADFVEDGTVPVIKIKNVKPYKILLNTVDYVKEETVIGKERFKIKHGDILITMTGNRKDGSPDSWVGKVAVFDIFGDYYLNQRLGIIEPDTSKVSTYYLSEFLSSWEMQKYFIERATSSGGQANISPDIIKKIEFAIPPKSEMDEFEQLASIYYEAIAKHQDEINKLEMIRDSLLPKLMSGQLDVSDLDI